MSHSRKVAEIDARGIEVHFSERVRSAFADLAAAAHFSEHFDGDMLDSVREWGAGRPVSVHEALTSLPLIAEETAKHVRATGDKRAEDAWQEVGLAMSEKGFSLTQARKRGK